MGDSFGNGDDFMWEGLACPPLEEYAFNFDTSTFKLDDMFDDPLLEGEEDDNKDSIANYSKEDEELDKIVAECLANPPTAPSHLLDDVPHVRAKFMVTTKSGQSTGRSKANIPTHSYGKGKELNIVMQVLEVEKQRNTCYDCKPKLQPKEGMRLDHNINQVVAVDNKRKANYDLRLKHVQRSGVKAVEKTNHPHHRYGNHGKGKELRTAIQVLNLNEAQIKVFLGETEEDVEKKAKKIKFMDVYDGQPMQRKDRKRLDDTNQLVVVDNKRNVEASRQNLHKAYERAKEAKQQKRIQVIEFQKPVTEQPRCKTKSKGKPSLRQKLMAMGTHKRNKKFQPFVY